MAFTLNRRLAQLVDSNGQLNTGKIPNDYISSDHIADNVITSAMLHTSFTVSTSNLTAIDTDDVSEGSSNLYFTNARADARIAAATTDDLSEGTNLYYTDARAQAVSINNVVEDTTPQLGGNLASNGNDILFADNDKAIFGTGSDLEIYHTGTESWIKDAGSGNLYIDSNGAAIQLTSGNAAKSMINAVPDGGVTLFHNNNIKLNTSSDGVTVTGNLAVTGDLDITGNVNSYNVTDLDVTDKTITLGAGQTEANSGGSGIIIDGSSASLLWDETATTWDFNNALNIDSPLDASLTLNKTSSSTWNYIQIVQQGTRNFYLGSDNTANFVFGADNSGDFYFTGGKVGINESSHDAYLHVTGKSSYTTANSSEVSGLEFIRLQPNSDSEHSLWIHNAGNNLGISGYTDAATTTIRDITLQTYGGKVGIGYDSPTHNLHIHDSSTGVGSTYIRVSREVDSSAVSRKAGIILGTRAANLGSTWRIESDSSSGYSDNARLQFIHNGGGTDANRMTLRHSGKLGIGTQSPSSYVHAALGNQALGFDAGFWASANPSDYTVGRGAGITMQNADVYTGGIYGIRENNDWTGALTFYTHTGSSGNTFGTSFTEKMRITSDGKVGIGTTDPESKLDIRTSSSSIDYALRITNTDTTDDNGAAILFQGRDTIGNAVNYGQLKFKYTNHVTEKSEFQLHHMNDSGVSSQVLTIDHDGHMGIGTDSPGAKLDVLSSTALIAQFARSGSATYDFTVTDGGDGAAQLYINAQTTNTGFNIRPKDANGTSIDALFIDPDGNIGIGNTSPTSNLTIGSSQSDGLEFTYDGTNTYRNRISNYWNSNTDTRMDFEIGRSGGVAPTTVLSVGYGGNVGIGITDPSNKLEVDGHIGFSKNGTDGNRYLLIEGADATYAGTLNIQAGFGSTAAGGAIKLYAHSHATYPGSVWIGRSAGASGNIMFGNGGTGPTSSSQIQMVINSSGYLGLHGQLSPTTPIHVGKSTSAASTIQITHEDNGGFGSIDIDAYGSATLRLLSNFSGSTVNGIASGAFALVTPHNRAILFGTNGSERARVANDGMFLPGADNTYDLGSTSKRWRNLYTTDLHLSNEGKPEGNEVDGTTGNWTIQEGEEHLYIINNKSGKKYRFALEEIE